MATFFDDLTKSADDLITKGFPAEGSFKISTETKTDNGVSLTTTGKRFFKGDDEFVEALFEPKFTWAAHNVEFTGKFSTLGEYETAVALKDLGAKGSKLQVTGNQGVKGWSLKPAAEFKNDVVATKLTVTVPDDRVSKPVNVEVSAVAAYEKAYNLGAKIKYATGFNKSKDSTQEPAISWGLRAAYVAPLWSKVLQFNHEGTAYLAGGAYHQKVTDLTTLAATFTVDHLEDVAAPGAAVAGEYKYAVDTILKGKFAVTPAKDFRIGLALTQNWTTASTVTIGADLNAINILGGEKGAAHSFGVEIKLK